MNKEDCIKSAAVAVHYSAIKCVIFRIGLSLWSRPACHVKCHDITFVW